jgi:uncharacterized OB-fold protein
MTHFDLKPRIVCPACGSNNNTATNVVGPDGPPDDGTVQICFECGHLGWFRLREGKITLESMTTEEVRQLSRRKEWPYIQSLIKEAQTHKLLDRVIAADTAQKKRRRFFNG